MSSGLTSAALPAGASKKVIGFASSVISPARAISMRPSISATRSPSLSVLPQMSVPRMPMVAVPTRMATSRGRAFFSLAVVKRKAPVTTSRAPRKVIPAAGCASGK